MRKFTWQPKSGDLSVTAFVQKIRHLDLHLHYLVTKRTNEGKRVSLKFFKEWERMYKRLMKFAGTKDALELAKIDD